MSGFDPFADFRMDNHVAIVTGGAQNIGEDIANAFLWLASPAGSWVSGQTLQVAGGGKRVRLMPE